MFRRYGKLFAHKAPTGENDTDSFFGPPKPRPLPFPIIVPVAEDGSTARDGRKQARFAKDIPSVEGLRGLRNSPQPTVHREAESSDPEDDDQSFTSKSSAGSKSRRGSKSSRAGSSKNSPSKKSSRKRKKPLAYDSVSSTALKLKKGQKKKDKYVLPKMEDDPEYQKFNEEMEDLNNYQFNVEDEDDYWRDTKASMDSERDLLKDQEMEIADIQREKGVKYRYEHRPGDPGGTSKDAPDSQFKRPKSPVPQTSGVYFAEDLPNASTHHVPKPSGRRRDKTKSAVDIRQSFPANEHSTRSTLPGDYNPDYTTIHVDATSRMSVDDPSSINLNPRTRKGRTKLDKNRDPLVDDGGPASSTPINAASLRPFSVGVSPVVDELPFGHRRGNLEEQFSQTERDHQPVSSAYDAVPQDGKKRDKTLQDTSAENESRSPAPTVVVRKTRQRARENLTEASASLVGKSIRNLSGEFELQERQNEPSSSTPINPLRSRPNSLGVSPIDADLPFGNNVPNLRKKVSPLAAASRELRSRAVKLGSKAVEELDTGGDDEEQEPMRSSRKLKTKTAVDDTHRKSKSQDTDGDENAATPEEEPEETDPPDVDNRHRVVSESCGGGSLGRGSSRRTKSQVVAVVSGIPIGKWKSRSTRDTDAPSPGASQRSTAAHIDVREQSGANRRNDSVPQSASNRRSFGDISPIPAGRENNHELTDGEEEEFDGAENTVIASSQGFHVFSDEDEPVNDPVNLLSRQDPDALLMAKLRSPIRVGNWRKEIVIESTPSVSSRSRVTSEISSDEIPAVTETPSRSSRSSGAPSSSIPTTPAPSARRQHSFVPIFSPAVVSSQESPNKSQYLYAQSEVGSARRLSVVTGARKKSALQLVLEVCHPPRVILTDSILGPDYKNLIKLGEGSYADVYSARRNGEDVVLKIMAVDGMYQDGEPQTVMNDILSEVLISRKITDALLDENGLYFAPVFAKTYFVRVAKGSYPDEFSSRHDSFARRCPADCLNQHPSFYGDKQRYVVIGLNNGGQALDAFPLMSFDKALSIYIQVGLGLSIAEEALEFEHRDLHISNILVRMVPSDKWIVFRRNGVVYNVKSYGVHVTIIDWTLSRMKDGDGKIVYKELKDDVRIFEGKGDEQYDVYRWMKDDNDNNWEQYVPRSNVHWLKYLQQKLLKEKHIKTDKGKNDPAYIALKDVLPARSKMKKLKSACQLVDSAEVFLNCRADQTK